MSSSTLSFFFLFLDDGVAEVHLGLADDYLPTWLNEVWRVPIGWSGFRLIVRESCESVQIHCA